MNRVISLWTFHLRRSKSRFKKVVFIIKEENEKDFKAQSVNRLSKVIDVSYVYQKLENIPEGFTVPEGRIKPFEQVMLS